MRFEFGSSVVVFRCGSSLRVVFSFCIAGCIFARSRLLVDRCLQKVKGMRSCPWASVFPNSPILSNWAAGGVSPMLFGCGGFSSTYRFVLFGDRWPCVPDIRPCSTFRVFGAPPPPPTRPHRCFYLYPEYGFVSQRGGFPNFSLLKNL